MINLLADPSGLLHFKLLLKGKVCISDLSRRCSDVESLCPNNNILQQNFNVNANFIT